MTPNQREALTLARDNNGELPVPNTSHVLRRTAQSLQRRGLFRRGVSAGWGTVYDLTDEGWTEAAGEQR